MLVGGLGPEEEFICELLPLPKLELPLLELELCLLPFEGLTLGTVGMVLALLPEMLGFPTGGGVGGGGLPGKGTTGGMSTVGPGLLASNPSSPVSSAPGWLALEAHATGISSAENQTVKQRTPRNFFMLTSLVRGGE